MSVALRFDAVDSANPAACVAFLDLVRRQEAAMRAKRAGYAMLGLQAGQRALDIGCGTGEDAVELARRVAPGGQAIGVDLSDYLVAVARARAETLAVPVTFEVGDVYSLPFADGSFDAARIDRVLHVLSSPLRALREAVRVVRPGGHIAITEPIWSTLHVVGGDATLTRLVLGEASPSTAGREIGAILPDLLPRFGLRLETKQGTSLALRDFATACRLFGLEQLGQRSVDTGRLSTATASQWLRSLESASESGGLEVSLRGMIVAGRKSVDQQNGLCE